MSDPNQDIFKFSPYKLIAPFADTRFWRNLTIGIVLHIVFIGLFSIGYLKAQILGEEPVADTPAPAQQVDPVTPQAAPSPTPAAQTPTTQTATDTGGDPRPGDSVIEQRIRETATPDEIPREPDLGISLEDTRIN